MPAIGAILGWVFSLVASFITWMTSAIVGEVIAQQVAESIMRVVRVAAVFALLVGLINLAIPDGIPISVVALWDDYAAQSSDWISVIGWLIPMDLLWSLVDLYLLGASVIFCIWIVRRVVEASQ